MIDFSTLQGLTIPEGVVTEITDADGRVLWTSWETSGNVILEVEKITSDTYAGSATYTGESFVLLDIYPKTNGTVTVTYGGVTKTVTDTSGAEEPNAVQVFFGTFNGVADEVETPASGELVIEGDYEAVARGTYSASKHNNRYFTNIKEIKDLGVVTHIPASAFANCKEITSVRLPSCVNTIFYGAFLECTGLASIVIPNGVANIEGLAFSGCTSLKKVHIPATITRVNKTGTLKGNPWAEINKANIITVAETNSYYKIDGNCLIEIATNKLISGFLDSVIPETVTSIDYSAFRGCTGLTSIAIPEAVTIIYDSAFADCTGLTGITIPAAVTSIGSSAFRGCTGLTSAIFANTLGWYVSTSSTATSGAPVKLADEANNATLLASTHSSKYWYYTAEPFAFAIGDQSVSCVYGLTWSEWVESEYNTLGLTIVNNRVQAQDGLNVCTENGLVSSADLVSPLETYFLSDGTFVINLVYDSYEYRAEYGMTWGEWLESEYNTVGLYPNDSTGWIYSSDGLTVLCTGTYESPTQVLATDVIDPDTVYRLYA